MTWVARTVVSPIPLTTEDYVMEDETPQPSTSTGIGGSVRKFLTIDLIESDDDESLSPFNDMPADIDDSIIKRQKLDLKIPAPAIMADGKSPVKRICGITEL